VPFRLNEWRAKIQFTTSARMPSDIYHACLATGTVSNTVYCQHALVDALARDLDIDRQILLDALPEPRARGKHLFAPGEIRNGVSIEKEQSGGVFRIGPANTDEEVR
jgi:hypothetical protein